MRGAVRSAARAWVQCTSAYYSSSTTTTTTTTTAATSHAGLVLRTAGLLPRQQRQRQHRHDIEQSAGHRCRRRREGIVVGGGGTSMMSCRRALSVWVLAGEPSGDALGARLLTALAAEAASRRGCPLTSHATTCFQLPYNSSVSRLSSPMSDCQITTCMYLYCTPCNTLKPSVEPQRKRRKKK